MSQNVLVYPTAASTIANVLVCINLVDGKRIALDKILVASILKSFVMHTGIAVKLGRGG